MVFFVVVSDYVGYLQLDLTSSIDRPWALIMIRTNLDNQMS